MMGCQAIGARQARRILRLEVRRRGDLVDERSLVPKLLRRHGELLRASISDEDTPLRHSRWRDSGLVCRIFPQAIRR